MKKFDVIKENTNQILVISGASGVGKTTTCALLGAMYPNIYVHIPFDRSRASRPGEFGSRYVYVEDMFKKYQEGEYFNIARVTHNSYSAIRTSDITTAFTNRKIAVLDFPLEQVDILKKTFPNTSITVAELIAPSEKERLRRLKKDHKFTDERIESNTFGAGRIERYKNNDLLTLDDHNIVVITERNRLKDAVNEIHRYMQIQTFNITRLLEIEQTGGVKGVQSFLKSLRCKPVDHSKSENYPFLEHKILHPDGFEK